MNALYGLARQAFLSAGINWMTDAIKAALITNTGTNAYALQVAGATNASPIVIQTSAVHGLSTGDQVIISNVGGNTAANSTTANYPWTVTVVDSTHFSLSGSTGNAAYTSGGWVIKISRDQYLSAIPGAGILATSVNISSQTDTLGVAGCADITFNSVSAGQSGDAVVFYKDTGTAGTSPLICYIDNATGLPVTPNGANIVFQIDRGSNHLFML